MTCRERALRRGPDALVAGRCVGRLLLVLPGVGYAPASPLLEYARQAGLAAGLTVQQVFWDVPEHLADPADWVRCQAETALAVEPPDVPVVVVGKSLGTFGTGYAAARSCPAIWLTPAAGWPEVVEVVRANPARQLVVGGTGDDRWTPRSPRRWPSALRRSRSCRSTAPTTRCWSMATRSARPRSWSRSPGRWCGSWRAEYPDIRLFSHLPGVATPDICWSTRTSGYSSTAPQCLFWPSESSAMLSRSLPWPSVSARLNEARTSFSASSRPTQLAPSTDLPGSSSL